MDMTYRFAWKEGDTALYLDALDCKYAAKNGNLAWRINNPGLVKHHCRFAKKEWIDWGLGAVCDFLKSASGSSSIKRMVAF